MRLLYVVRLFSGLEDGLREGKWRPRGVPTIYRMIEVLDRSNHDVRFVFTCKDMGSSWAHSGHRTFQVDGLRNPVTVLAGGNSLPRILGRTRGYLREARQALPIRRLQKEFRPDVMYFDRVNIFQAALAARFTCTPVVWRVMGVPPAMHGVLKSSHPAAAATRAAYRSPFAMVICSRDGSGGEAWMDKALAKDTPRRMMINGADAEKNVPLATDISAALPKNRTKVLFIARLVEDKGCMAFMQGFVDALAEVPGKLHAVIAGDGPFAAPMKTLAAEHGAGESVSFLGQVPHDQITALHEACDIYVSLNPMCNLTNANLEALRCGACMVIPAAQPETGIDMDTDELVPSEAALRVASADDSGGLACALLRLQADPGERKSRAAMARETARRILPSWDERIAGEIALLEQLAATGRAN